jgi:Fe-S cluster biogenesis protein NfuA
MSSGNPSNELNELSVRINDLVERIEFIGDPAVRANVITLVQSLMDLHRRGFERTTEIISGASDNGALLNALAADELVGGLLTLYGLHPDSLESRVKSAVDKARASVLSGSDTLQLLSIEDGIARLHLTTQGSGCGSSSAQLEKSVRDAIAAAVPDLAHIEIHCEVRSAHRANDLVQLQVSSAAD